MYVSLTQLASISRNQKRPINYVTRSKLPDRIRKYKTNLWKFEFAKYPQKIPETPTESVNFENKINQNISHEKLT
jgi:hypothetical protein